MAQINRLFSLRDGREVLIRNPDQNEDLDRFVSFAKDLPPDRQIYLEQNMQDPLVCRHYLLKDPPTDHVRILAELDGRIIGIATLDRRPHGWQSHVAQLQCVVDPDFGRIGIGTKLFKALVAYGREHQIGRLLVEVSKRKDRVIHMLEQLGFEREATIRNFAKDPAGNLYDIILMSNDLESVWQALLETMDEMDNRFSNMPGIA